MAVHMMSMYLSTNWLQSFVNSSGVRSVFLML